MVIMYLEHFTEEFTLLKLVQTAAALTASIVFIVFIGKKTYFKKIDSKATCVSDSRSWWFVEN